MIELDLNHDEIPIGTKIKIIGVGGAGNNAINTMIQYDLKCVEFIAVNTDISDLKKSRAQIKVQMGREVTRGLGAGSNPDIGRKAAEESREELKKVLKDTDLLFIAAGMGGGTGTGASPIIAALAKEMNILTIAIVSSPFNCEGKKKIINAEKGLKKLKDFVDTLIVIPNEKIKLLGEDLTLIDAYKKTDNILYEAAKAVSDIIHFSGYVNVDFADVKTVMSNHGMALIGSAQAEGENRAIDAINMALNNPLLTEMSVEKAKGILINITAGTDFKLNEFETINNEIVKNTNDDDDIVIGVIFDDELSGKLHLTAILTGLESSVLQKKDDEIISSEDIVEDDDEDDISKALSRIKSADSPDLHKKPQEDENEFSGRQMEIPAFIRKFSN